MILRQQSRQKMNEFRSRAQEFSTEALSKRLREQPLEVRSNNSQNVHQSPSVKVNNPSIRGGPRSIPRNNSFENESPMQVPSYRAGSRADQSALEHIRRIR